MEAALQLALTLALLVGSALSLSSGAPETICSEPNLKPSHKEANFQSSQSPYILEATEGNKSGEFIVTIRSPGNDVFKGYVIKAFDPKGKTLGSFHEDPKHKYLDCDSIPRSAVTHSSSHHKTEVSVTWQAPDDFKGEVELKATVVKDSQTFWSVTKKVTVV